MVQASPSEHTPPSVFGVAMHWPSAGLHSPLVQSLSSAEQSLAVLKTAEAQDQLSDEERAYMVKTTANIVATIPVVEASVSSSADLVEQVPDLVEGARGAFGVRRAGGVARNVQRSGDRISEIPSRGAGLIESLIVLREGLSLVNAG